VTTPIVIVGAGGHGRELADVVDAINEVEPRYELLGCVDDGAPDRDRLARLGLSHLGPLNTLESMADDVRCVLGLGSGELRHRFDEWATSLGRQPVTLVHPTAVVGSDVQLDPGVVICALASVTTNVRLGRHTHLNVAVSVAHDVRVGSYVTLSPGCRLSGNVIVEDGVIIGTAAVVLPGVRIGRDTVVGAGAVVTRDLPPAVVAIGVPARVVERPSTQVG
jgi:sugar O-acyltransferase (sialic acid O-acetyltransferase NeuD family)